ncbi:hypothetical protein TRVL_04788 [Trypanosoma vivax]|nr:hypothetical protein TRVL_04788 [Trypanosoma vivax]
MLSANLRPDDVPWTAESPIVSLAKKAGHANQPKPNSQPKLRQSPAKAYDPSVPPQLSPTAAKLFVGQLPFESDEKRLYDLFSAYGTVEHIHILRDGQNRSKGAAFVTYSNVEGADTAIFTLHNRYKMLANRMIQVSYAKNSPNISPFGARNAIAVHRMNPTNPVPDMAHVDLDEGMF